MKRKKGISPDLGDFPGFEFSNIARSGEIPKAPFNLTVKSREVIIWKRKVSLSCISVLLWYVVVACIDLSNFTSPIVTLWQTHN